MSPRPWKERVEDIIEAIGEIYDYFGMDPEIIWDTVQNDLPPLVEPLKKIR